MYLAHARIDAFDLLGRALLTANESVAYEPGVHAISIPGGMSGIVFVRVTMAGGKAVLKKLVCVR